MPSTSHATDPGTRDCPNCGTAVAVDANFCSHCGMDLDESSLPAYCSTCGDPFDHDDEFCTNCGTARNNPAKRPSQSPHPSPNSNAAQSLQSDSPTSSSHPDRDSDAYRTFRRQVQQHLRDGWEMKHDYGDRVTLVDRDIGSIPIHVLLLLFTGGLGNLLYGWYHYSECARTRHLSVDDPTPDSTTDVTTDRASPTETNRTDDGEMVAASSYVMGVFMALIGLVLLVAGLSAGTLMLSTVGLALTVSGLYIMPAVRRRLERRHGLTAVGRRRTVDHRVVHPTEQCDESCVVCGESIESGFVRRRRDETVLAGVPVRTHAMEYNHYCPSCARQELVDSTDDLELVDTDESAFEDAETLEDDLESLLEDDSPEPESPDSSDVTTETLE